MLVAAKQETLAPLLCSLHVEKELDKAKKKKKSRNKIQFSRYFLSNLQSPFYFIAFYRNFLSNTDLMDCSPDDPCYLITTQQLSRHCFHYKQQNTWLCLLNHSGRFLQPCLLAPVPYLKLSTSCLPSPEAEMWYGRSALLA